MREAQRRNVPCPLRGWRPLLFAARNPVGLWSFASGHQQQGGYVYVGIHTVSLPQALAEARKRIILNLALYDRFARSPDLCDALSCALGQPGFGRLSIITIPFISRKAWLDEFLQLLRPGQGIAETEHEFAASRDFIVRLAVRHEGLVEVYETRALPCVPCIIIDDRIIFGHYAHATVPAEQGYWFSVNAPVDELLMWAASGRPAVDATPRQLAAYRFVSDCHNAMRQAKRMLL